MEKLIFVLRSLLRSIFKAMRAASIRQGHLFPARVAAYWAGKPLTEHDYELIIAHNIKYAWVDVAMRAAALAGRELTVSEYTFMRQKAVNNGSLSSAEKIACIMGQELMPKELNIIFLNCHKEGQLKRIAARLQGSY